MSSLEGLPPDQRAVLDLVLKQGRSYDEIAQMLRIDRAGVRDRALAAFDALGPRTRVVPERRALVTDYLLGQLPPRVAEGTRERLGQSAGERAWARVLASELAPIASRPLPDIPAESVKTNGQPVERSTAHDVAAPTGAPGLVAPAAAAGEGPDTAPAPQRSRVRPSSRLGGAIVLGAGALVVAAIVTVVLFTGGSSSTHATTHAPSAAAKASTRTGAATASTSTSSKNSAKVVGRINLRPTVSGSKATGIVLVVKQGTKTGIAILAKNIPANGKHDAYAVWLYNSPADSDRLGFVSPPVGANGILEAEAPLPSNAAHFKQILLTLETVAKPRTPGKQVLHGKLTGL